MTQYEEFDRHVTGPVTADAAPENVLVAVVKSGVENCNLMRLLYPVLYTTRAVSVAIVLYGTSPLSWE